MSVLVATGLVARLGGRAVLDGVDVAFVRGQVTAILGPNGAGKSTLLSCLAGLRKPDAGQVSLDGADLAALPPRTRARSLAFIPQLAEVAWPIDTRTLVGLGRTPFLGARGPGAEDASAVEAAMAQADVARFADRIVSTLSGGERARVLIARALATRPVWLLADEPLTGLDPGHQIDALRLFRTLAGDQDCGVIVALHDLSLAARMADRIIVLSEGRVLADAEPCAALTPEILARAYGVEARVVAGAAGPIIDVVTRAGDGQV